MTMQRLLEDGKDKGYEPPVPKDAFQEFINNSTAQFKEDMHRAIEEAIRKELDKPLIKYLPLWAGLLAGLLAVAINCVIHYFN